MDKVLAQAPLTVPTLLVHSQWDQEDIYGAPAVWSALKDADKSGNLFFTMGPWYHGQAIKRADTLGALRWIPIPANGGAAMCWPRSWRTVSTTRRWIWRG